MIATLRAALRLLFFALGSLYYIALILVANRCWGPDVARTLRWRQRWFAQIVRGMGVQIEVRGELPQGGGLLVCNHRSYFDPLIIMPQSLAIPVGKIEMRHWPIIGIGAAISGVVFVDRQSVPGRRAARAEIRQKLREGYFVINFPEGTTHHDAQTRAFKPGVFKDAAAAKLPIYPVALEYQLPSDAWVGDDTFLRHFMACFGKRRTHIRVHYGPAIRAERADELIDRSQGWIDRQIRQLRSDWYAIPSESVVL